MTGNAGSVRLIFMAAPAKAPAGGPRKPASPPGKPAPKGGPPGKGGKPGPGVKDKPVAADEAPPAAPEPAPRLNRLRLVIFGALAVAMAGTLGAASWIIYFKEEEHPLVDIPPPEPAPPRPTGPVVRQGDLSDELWRRMGVRPQGE
jgi:hypothetical protein